MPAAGGAYKPASAGCRVPCPSFCCRSSFESPTAAAADSHLGSRRLLPATLQAVWEHGKLKLPQEAMVARLCGRTRRCLYQTCSSLLTRRLVDTLWLCCVPIAELAGQLLPQEAMDATLRADKALPLLDAAADKFAEVTISGEAATYGHRLHMTHRKGPASSIMSFAHARKLPCTGKRRSHTAPAPLLWQRLCEPCRIWVVVATQHADAACWGLGWVCSYRSQFVWECDRLAAVSQPCCSGPTPPHTCVCASWLQHNLNLINQSFNQICSQT